MLKKYVLRRFIFIKQTETETVSLLPTILRRRKNIQEEGRTYKVREKGHDSSR